MSEIRVKIVHVLFPVHVLQNLQNEMEEISKDTPEALLGNAVAPPSAFDGTEAGILQKNKYIQTKKCFKEFIQTL